MKMNIFIVFHKKTGKTFLFQKTNLSSVGIDVQTAAQAAGSN